jgi:HAE1 family hydrophobic/amphiphilic exporter-1
MVEYEKKIADMVSQDPNVESLMASVGGATASTLGGPNYGELVVHLKPRSERAMGVDQIIRDLRPKLASFAGMKVYLQNPPTIRIGGKVSKSLYQFSMQSPDKARQPSWRSRSPRYPAPKT